MKNLSAFLWGAAIGVVFMGLVTWHKMTPPASIPTTWELQQTLKDAGYYQGRIDGRIGPETLKAWDKAICQQEYERARK
jgi:peptidoglycan hydrolase-like protein with peptidoglycan-binding domain